MASINGITVKAMKEFVGHEGYCKQGNIYIDNKKQGFWSQDSWGGPDIFEFDTTLLLERIKEYCEKNPPIDTLKLYDMDIKEIDFNNLPVRTFEDILEPESAFLYELTGLLEIEKHFKKAIKQGYSMIGHLKFYHVKAPIPNNFPDLIYACDKKQIKDYFKEITNKYPYAYVTIYKSLDDFIEYDTKV